MDWELGRVRIQGSDSRLTRQDQGLETGAKTTEGERDGVRRGEKTGDSLKMHERKVCDRGC